MLKSYGPKVVSSALRDPFRIIQRKGGDAHEIYQSTGFSGGHDGDVICLRGFVKFSELAATRLNQPELGWEIGTEFDLGNMGPVGQFILDAPSLGAGLVLLMNSFSMVQNDTAISLSVKGHEAVLNYRILDLNIWPRQQDVELSISTFLQLIKRAAGPGWRPTKITLEHAPSPIWKNAKFGPKCKVDYLALENSIVFPSRLLDLPLHAEDSNQFFAVSKALSDESRTQERRAPVTVQVRREIVKRFGSERLDQTEIAVSLGLSRRTLRRRLENEERSFSGILKDCRIRRAEHMLSLPDVPLSLIAEYLGYADVTPFERAFRTVSGLTPAQYRKHSVPERAVLSR